MWKQRSVLRGQNEDTPRTVRLDTQRAECVDPDPSYLPGSGPLGLSAMNHWPGEPESWDRAWRGAIVPRGLGWEHGSTGRHPRCGYEATGVAVTLGSPRGRRHGRRRELCDRLSDAGKHNGRRSRVPSPTDPPSGLWLWRGRVRGHLLLGPRARGQCTRSRALFRRTGRWRAGPGARRVVSIQWLMVETGRLVSRPGGSGRADAAISRPGRRGKNACGRQALA